jgi:hypothetical protein
MPAIKDAVAAFLQWHHGHSIVKKLEYGITPFVFRHHEFAGKSPSFTGTCPDGTLTIETLGKHPAEVDFSTDSMTRYKQKDRASNCDSVTASYSVKERINVTGGELTDDTWYAEVVNANPR